MTKREIAHISQHRKIQPETAVELQGLLQEVLGYESWIIVEINAGVFVKTVTTQMDALKTIENLKRKQIEASKLDEAESEANSHQGEAEAEIQAMTDAEAEAQASQGYPEF